MITQKVTPEQVRELAEKGREVVTPGDLYRKKCGCAITQVAFGVDDSIHQEEQIYRDVLQELGLNNQTIDALEHGYMGWQRKESSTHQEWIDCGLQIYVDSGEPFNHPVKE